jgi:hypothetical protein
MPGVTADTSHKALRKSSPGADPAAAAVVREAEAIPFRFQSSAPDEIVYDAIRSKRRAVVGDMLRLGTITAVEQGPLGILRTAAGPTFHTSNSRERLYSQLEQAYSTWKTPETPLVIELWEQGQKIGEYSDGVFNFGAGYTTPLDCSEPGPGGICGYRTTTTMPTPSATETASTTVPPPVPGYSTQATDDGAVPPNVYFVVDSRNRMYVHVSCQSATNIPPASRLYYRTEYAASKAGYAPSRKC